MQPEQQERAASAAPPPALRRLTARCPLLTALADCLAEDGAPLPSADWLSRLNAAAAAAGRAIGAGRPPRPRPLSEFAALINPLAPGSAEARIATHVLNQLTRDCGYGALPQPAAVAILDHQLCRWAVTRRPCVYVTLICFPSSYRLTLPRPLIALTRPSPQLQITAAAGLQQTRSPDL